MVEQYFTYMIGSELKPGVGISNTYNADVTDSDLRCWALSAKTCAMTNSKALNNDYKKSKRKWKHFVKRNKCFSILTMNEEVYPPELQLGLQNTENSKTGCIDEIHCNYKHGETHSLERDDMPLAVTCPSCWSSLRIPGESKIMPITPRCMIRRKKLKNSFQFKRAIASKTINRGSYSLSNLSPASKAVRNIRKVAVVKASRNLRKELLILPVKSEKNKGFSGEMHKMLTRNSKRYFRSGKLIKHQQHSKQEISNSYVTRNLDSSEQEQKGIPECTTSSSNPLKSNDNVEQGGTSKERSTIVTKNIDNINNEQDVEHGCKRRSTKVTKNSDNNGNNDKHECSNIAKAMDNVEHGKRSPRVAMDNIEHGKRSPRIAKNIDDHSKNGGHHDTHNSKISRVTRTIEKSGTKHNCADQRRCTTSKNCENKIGLPIKFSSEKNETNQRLCTSRGRLLKPKIP